MRKIFSTRYNETIFAIGLFLLRALSGALMIPHGYDKIKKYGDYVGIFGDPIHIGNPLSLYLSIFAEFFCAILIIAGLATRLAAIPLIINMTVAVFVAHQGDVFGKGQQATLFLVIFTAILFLGPGKLSADRILGK